MLPSLFLPREDNQGEVPPQELATPAAGLTLPGSRTVREYVSLGHKPFPSLWYFVTAFKLRQTKTVLHTAAKVSH